ncbi:MAG: Gmad2 immunoglobulin-like domain-containing protein [Propioniciclava sp.]
MKRVAAAWTGAVLAAAMTACAPQPAAPPTSVRAVTPAPSAGATTPSGQAPVLVYFPRVSPAGIRLAREERAVPADDPLAGAVAAMLAGPRDPDYARGWPEGTRLLGVSTAGETTTIDLSGEAQSTTLGSEGAGMAAEQLIWTVTELQGERTAVMLTIDGQPAGDLWGVLDWGAPRIRGDVFDIRTPVSIDVPVDGARVTSPVTITGDALAFEANLPWQVRDADGEIVERGAIMTADGTRFAAYSFTVDLSPGEYTVEVLEDDPSGGEGHPPATDTRRIIVAG